MVRYQGYKESAHLCYFRVFDTHNIHVELSVCVCGVCVWGFPLITGVRGRWPDRLCFMPSSRRFRVCLRAVFLKRSVPANYFIGSAPVVVGSSSSRSVRDGTWRVSSLSSLCSSPRGRCPLTPSSEWCAGKKPHVQLLLQRISPEVILAVPRARRRRCLGPSSPHCPRPAAAADAVRSGSRAGENAVERPRRGPRLVKEGQPHARGPTGRLNA